MHDLLATIQNNFGMTMTVYSSRAQQGCIYCWMHGSTSNMEHTSGTCKNKANNHKDTATWTNKM